MKGLDRSQRHLLKVIATILSSQPWEFGVVLEEGGWLRVKELQKVLWEEGLRAVTEKSLLQLFTLFRPEGIEFKDGMVRAIQGHARAHEYREGVCPPERLYIGLRERALKHVRRHGLEAHKDRMVVLSASKEMAERIIRRKTGRFLVVEVKALDAFNKGLSFKDAGKGLYTVPYLIPKWLILPELKKEKEKKVEEGKTRQRVLPGSFDLDLSAIYPSFPEEKGRRRRKRRWVNSKEKRRQKGKGKG